MSYPRTRACAALAAAALATLALAGCSGAPDLSGVPVIGDLVGQRSVAEAKASLREAQVQAVSDEVLVTAGTLTVGIPADETVPLAITGTDGGVSGIDVDVAYALADELGLTRVTFVSVSDAESGVATCDVVMGAQVTDASEAVSVQGNYAQSALGVFGRNATAPITAEDLSGKTVGVQAGSVSASALSDLDLAITQSTFSNLNEAFMALDDGTVDYVVSDAYAGAYLASAYESLSFAGILDDAVFTGVATAASSTELTAAVTSALETIQANGVVGVARARWVGTLPSLGEAEKVSGVVVLPDGEAADGGDSASDAAATDTPADATPAE